ncbi:MAG: cyclic nucleotide-binding domain-containing protein [Mariprofundaceae bacterium]|nr:cyclic nucleotide-binding domain-containing protein [Mariprofundaceae bacterium]
MLASLSAGELIYLRTLTVGFRSGRGVQVIKEGQQNNYLFLLKSGVLKVEKTYHDRLYSLAYITPGQMFGESSFLYGTAAGATVTTIETCDIYQIHSHEMHAILDGNEQFKREVIQTSEYRLASGALAVNHVFHSLPTSAREIILYNARFVKLNEGELLYRDGDSSNHFMCIVIGGRAEISVDNPDCFGERIILGEVAVGDEVGEIALVTEEPHTANVRALTLLRLLMVSTDTILAFRDRYHEFSTALDACIEDKLKARDQIVESQRNFLS